MNSQHNESRPLFRQYLGIFLAAVLATLALLSYFFWNSYRQTEKSVEASLQSTASIVETRLTATLQRMDADLRGLTQTIPLEALLQQNHARHAGGCVRIDLNGQSGFATEP